MPGCLVVLQCLYHVSCVRIVGWSWSSTPLAGSDVRHCVSCLLGLRMPHILRSCPSHTPQISENSCVGVPTDHWSVAALLASELSLDDPSSRGAHGVPSRLLMRPLFQVSGSFFARTDLAVYTSCAVPTMCSSLSVAKPNALE